MSTQNVNRTRPRRLWDERDLREDSASQIGGARSSRGVANPGRTYSDAHLYRRILAEARPYWPHVSGIFLLSLLATPVALLTPLPLKIAVDSVIGSHPLPGFVEPIAPAALQQSDSGLLVLLAILAIGVVAIGGLRTLASSLLEAYAGERLVLEFRTKLFRHGQRLSFAYHDAKGTADAAYRIQYDTSSIRSIVLSGVTPFLTAFFTLVGMIAVTARIDWQLALIALAVTPFLLALTMGARARLRRGWRDTKQLESSALAVIQEVFTGLRIVKAFGTEEREHERFLHRSAEGMRARLRLALFEGAFGLLASLVVAAGTAGVLVVGIRHVQDGVLTLGSLVLVMAYLTQLYAPLRTISQSIARLQSALASAERAFAVLDEAPDVPERRDAAPIRRASGHVEFRNVSFAYEHDRQVLRDISFAVPPGTRVGIAGTTGAGKTTLVSLLARFYDPSEGEIRLDGVDLRDYKVDDLRSQFGIVLQEPMLFSTTIAENVAYARPEAGEDEIIEAAKAANAHDFIAALPQGYETVVGERGMRLSGGERQRISLARAFLKDAPILILDEPTSSVDVKTEAVIMEAMGRLMEGRTAFMIAHRLTTLEHCDVRLHLEHGRLVEAGSERPPRDGVQTASPGDTGRPERTKNRTGRHAGQRRVDSHPAFRAWLKLWPSSTPPRQIQSFRRKSVYRLAALALDGGSVIAKCERLSNGTTERDMYEHVLPQLRLPVPRYYGCVDDADAGVRWLFVEDVGDHHYRSRLPAHRELAARWLADLHVRGAHIAAVDHALPELGSRQYRDALRSARLRLVDLAQSDSCRQESRSLFVLAMRLYELDIQWRAVECLLAELPRTLVHGDFVGKNVRIRGSNGSLTVVPFDWADAGAGTPAVDLWQLAGQPELTTYSAIVRSAWPQFGPEEVGDAAVIGQLLRSILAFDWATLGLKPDWLDGRMSTLRVIGEDLTRVASANGLQLR